MCNTLKSQACKNISKVKLFLACKENASIAFDSQSHIYDSLPLIIFPSFHLIKYTSDVISWNWIYQLKIHSELGNYLKQIWIEFEAA